MAGAGGASRGTPRLFGGRGPAPIAAARRLVEALPPATDEPGIDEAAAPPPRRRTACGGCCGASRLALAGLLLVAIDAGGSLVLPVLIRHGIDQGVTQRAARCARRLGLALVTVAVQWLVQTGETRMTGRTGERVLYTLRLKIFAQLQRLGLDYYERELTGRIMTRMTTDVDALSTFLQTGLVTAFVSVVTFFGIMVALLCSTSGSSSSSRTLSRLLRGTYVFRESVRRYELARERISVVNADFQEGVAGVTSCSRSGGSTGRGRFEDRRRLPRLPPRRAEGDRRRTSPASSS